MEVAKILICIISYSKEILIKKLFSSRVDPGDIPLKEVPVREGSDRMKKVVDCQALNAILSYAGSRLESARFTA